jgi:surfeit locus 1 family protein
VWQINRFFTKYQISVTSSQNSNQKISPTKNIDSPDLHYKFLRFEGYFLYEKEIFVYRNFKCDNDKKKNVGTYVILTPFQTSGGKIIMVLRGIKPADKNVTSLKYKNNLITLQGIAMPSEKESSFIKSFDDKNNIWFVINLNKIATVLQQDLITSYYIVAEPNALVLTDDLSSINFQDYMNLTKAKYWYHLFYAINWFIIALALIIIYLLYRKSSTTAT